MVTIEGTVSGGSELWRCGSKEEFGLFQNVGRNYMKVKGKRCWTVHIFAHVIKNRNMRI